MILFGIFSFFVMKEHFQIIYLKLLEIITVDFKNIFAAMHAFLSHGIRIQIPTPTHLANSGSGRGSSTFKNIMFFKSWI